MCVGAPEKEMATHSSILAWEIPWTQEPGGPWGRKELDMTEQPTLSLFTFKCCVWFFLYIVPKACQVLATCFRNSVNISWIGTCLRNVFISTEQIPYKNLNINHRYLQCLWDLHPGSLCHLTVLLKGVDCFKVCCEAFLLGTLYPGSGCALYA